MSNTGCQKRRVEVTLSADATVTVMPTLGERFLCDGSALMTSLAELGVVGRELGDRSASICSFALEEAHEGSRRTKRHTATKLFLKSAIGQLFHADVVALRQKEVN